MRTMATNLHGDASPPHTNFNSSRLTFSGLTLFGRCTGRQEYLKNLLNSYLQG